MTAWFPGRAPSAGTKEADGGALPREGAALFHERAPRPALALIAHSQKLLVVMRDRSQDAALAELLQGRTELLKLFGEAASRGDPVSAEEVRELRRLDRELLDAVTGRRETAARALAALCRGRSAGQAYQDRPRGAPRYLDRAG